VTLGCHNSAIITDRWKFTTKISFFLKITLYGISIFTVGIAESNQSIQSHSPGLYTPYITERIPWQILCDVGRPFTTRVMTSSGHVQVIQ